MQEKYTKKAFDVLQRAKEAAAKLGNEYIGTEHILLGLTLVQQSVAAKALEGQNVTYHQVMERICEMQGEKQKFYLPLDMTPRAKRVVERSKQEAVRLAERYGADVTKARVAALLHDCTKKLDMAEQLALCVRYRIPLDELERKALKLLHSKTGAAIARDVFAVDDEVYNAILYHTTGKPDMTLLEKIIYLADYIEPTRDFPGVEELRRTVYEDLDRGLLLGLTMTIQEMEELGNPVHHMTRDARDYLMKRGIS